MDSPTPPTPSTRPLPLPLLQRIALACGALTICIGVLVLVGWATQTTWLTSVFMKYRPSAPNAALLFVLLGSALCIHVACPDSRLVRLCRLVVVGFCTTLAFVTLMAWLLGDSLDVNCLIFPHGTGTFSAISTGHMSPFCACFSLLCCAALLRLEFKANAHAAILGTLVLMFGFVTALGYVYGTPLFYSGSVPPMVLYSALSFLVFGLGLISAAGPAVWPLNTLVGSSTRVRLLRWFLPSLLILLVLGNVLTVMFEQAGGARVLVDTLLLAAVCVLVFRLSNAIGATIDRAEEDVRKSEALFRAVYDNAGFGLTIADTSGNFLRINPFLCKMLGYTENELKKISVWDVTVAEDIPAVEDAMQRLLIGLSQCEEIEKRHLRKDGQSIWCHATLALIRDERGLPLQFVAQAHDITRRSQAEMALRKSELKFRTLFENSKDAIFLMTDKGFLDCNAATVELFRLSCKEDIIGTHPSVYSPPFQPNGQDSMSAAVDKINEALSNGYACFEWVHRRKDGEDFPVEVMLNAIEYDGEKLLQASVRDLTQRKRAEEALRQSEDRLNFVLDSNRIGAWDLDLLKHTTIRTLRHDRIFGYKTLQPKWTFEMFIEHVLPEDRAEVSRQFRESISMNNTWNFECRILRFDGEVRWIWAAGQPRLVENGQVRCISGIVQDITERKRAEAALRDVATHRNLIEASLDPLVTLDANGMITELNDATVLATGVERKALLGTDFYNYFTNPEKARSSYQQAIQKGQVRDYELELKHQDGHFTPVLYNAMVCRDKAGHVVGVFAAARRKINGEINTATSRR